MRIGPFFAVAALICGFNSAQAETKLNLCGNVVEFDVRPAPADASADQAEFLGQWGAGVDKWDGVLCHVLIVTDLKSGGEVSAMYVSGDATQWRVKRNVWSVTGKVEGQTLVIRVPDGSIATYVLDKEGSVLNGSYKSPYSTTRVTLAKVR